MSKYPGPQGPATRDRNSTMPAVGVHEADERWRWPAHGTVSPPNPAELKSERQGVGTNAKPLRTAGSVDNDLSRQPAGYGQPRSLGKLT
jgi:hypothetical protein